MVKEKEKRGKEETNRDASFGIQSPIGSRREKGGKERGERVSKGEGGESKALHSPIHFNLSERRLEREEKGKEEEPVPGSVMNLPYVPFFDDF